MKPHPPKDQETLSANLSQQPLTRSNAIEITLVVRLAAILTAVCGILVLAGWVFGLPLLKSVLPGAVEMKANTAVALLFAGCALFILGNRPPPLLQHFAQALALAVGALGVATLGQYLFGWQLGIDELLFRDTAGTYAAVPGRMSPYSAVAFAAIGLALASLPRPGLRPMAWWAAVVMVAIGVLSFLGYLWNASELVTDRFLPPVAVNTAVAFILLGAGTLLAARGPDTRPGLRPLALSAVETKILAGFTGALLLLLAGGGFTYRATAKLGESSQWVIHTQQVRAALRDVYAALSDAESAQRDYLITGKPQRLDRYAALAFKVRSQIEFLPRLLADNPAQLANLTQFRLLVSQRLDLLTHAIDLYQRHGFAAARDFVASEKGIATMQAIFTFTARMDAIEESLLVEREAMLVHARHRTLVSLLLSLLGATIALVMLFRGIRREMVARHEAEQLLVNRSAELASANRFLDSVIENIPDMIFVKDAAELRFVRFNRAGEELLGYSRTELIGKNDYDFFPKDEAEFFTSRDREVLTNKMVVEIPEEPIHTRNKGERILHTKKIPILDEHRQPNHLLGISEDVTERKEKEREILRLNAALELRAAELDAANKELESFSYSVSHDLRAPLRHINGYVDMLAEETAGQLADEPKRYLRVIADASLKMGRLIDDLLEFSRMGRTEMHESRVDLNDLVRESMADLETQTSEHHIAWNIAPLPAVEGDRAMIRQVLVNLLGNAVKYSRGRNPAQIEMGLAGEEDDRVVLFVRDNGAGFNMQYANKLFGVFQRLHRQDEFEGTGVGLASVQRIINRHGGRVWAEAAPDKGATFYFTLKRAR